MLVKSDEVYKFILKGIGYIASKEGTFVLSYGNKSGQVEWWHILIIKLSKQLKGMTECLWSQYNLPSVDYSAFVL